MDNEIELYFKDIDCAACAQKVEHLLNQHEQIKEARVLYLHNKIKVKYDDEVEDIRALVEEITRKIEVDAEIFYTKEELEEDEEHHHDHCDGECHHHEEHHHHHKNKLEINYFMLCGAILAVIAFVLQKLVENNVIDSLFVRIIYLASYSIGYLLLAYKIIIKSFKNIIRGNVFDENFLMLVASLGAFILSYLIEFKVLSGELEFIEGILVILLYNIGEYFQDKALDKSTDSIASLTSLKVDKTTLEDGTVVETSEVKVGERILIKVGDRVPLDGIIVSGESSLDTKALTGESLPKDVVVGDEVLSGTINLSNVLTLEVIRVNNESMASKIQKMVEEANEKKSRTEEFISKFARIYTPVVIILAVIVFLVEWLLLKEYFSLTDALNNCFVFLVSSCPCALVISIPLSFFGGIGKCSAFGILVKGGNYIEALAKIKHISFDKTGTLTKGNFKIKEINSENIDETDYFLDILASVESYSNHPIAKAITAYHNNPNKYQVTDIKEVAGFGLVASINGKEVLCGNQKLMEKYNIDFELETCPGSVVYCSYDGKYLGNVLIVDEIKEECYQMVKDLDDLGIKTYMLTGDRKEIGEAVANKLGIGTVYTDLLPDEKLAKLQSIIDNKNKNETVAYIGDGINDTPALKLADVGIAVGGFGHDEAIETSDVVLMSDEMDKLPKAIKISKFTLKILYQNVIFALIVKFIVMIIGMIGILGSKGMFLGVFADVGVCLLCILNTLRIIKFKEK